MHFTIWNVVELSSPVNISSINRAFRAPTIISLEEKIKALQVSASQIIKTPGESGSQSGIKNNLYAIFKKNRSLKL